MSNAQSWIPGSQRSQRLISTFSNLGNRDDRSSVLLASIDNVDPEVDLMEMDVVVYSETSDDNGTKKLGAVQEDGRITTLCAWTNEPAFGSFLELLVDEEDLLPGYRVEDGSIRIHSIVPESLLSYGSRQVNGGMGPGNPHGEESEMLYYIHKSIIDGVELEVKPDLEIFW